jgi:serine/threonine kinase 38
VGTPDYIAPEMLRREGYGELVDWWALGVIIYEMLIGYAPFAADSNEQTYYKIEHHDQFLYFPPEAPLSLPVVDLISRLLAEPHHRLGSNGPAEIKAHPWFSGVNWLDIRTQTAPFEPALESEIDTRYFDRYEESEPWIYEGPEETGKKDFNFIGYTYKMETEPSRNMVQ